MKRYSSKQIIILTKIYVPIRVFNIYIVVCEKRIFNLLEYRYNTYRYYEFLLTKLIKNTVIIWEVH